MLGAFFRYKSEIRVENVSSGLSKALVSFKTKVTNSLINCEILVVLIAWEVV